MWPLFLAAAWPVKVEQKMSPYFGVLPLVSRALETWSLCWALGIAQTPGLGAGGNINVVNFLLASKVPPAVLGIPLMTFPQSVVR